MEHQAFEICEILFVSRHIRGCNALPLSWVFLGHNFNDANVGGGRRAAFTSLRYFVCCDCIEFTYCMGFVHGGRIEHVVNIRLGGFGEIRPCRLYISVDNEIGQAEVRTKTIIVVRNCCINVQKGRQWAKIQLSYYKIFVFSFFLIIVLISFFNCMSTVVFCLLTIITSLVV